MVARELSQAVHHQKEQIAQQVLRLIQEGEVVGLTGEIIPLKVETICLHGDGDNVVENLAFLAKTLVKIRFMLAPFKQMHLSEQIVSLCFETTRNCDIKELKKKLHADFPSLREVTHTFNRVNMIFDKSTDFRGVTTKIDEIDWSHFKAKQSHEYWEIPICFDPHYPSDLMTVYKGDKSAVKAYKATFYLRLFV